MTTCWIITEGLKGTENQCLALAQAAGLNTTVKIVKLKQPWKTVTPWIRHFSKIALATGSSEFNAPWPDIIIASGRKAIAPSLWIKKQSKGRTKLVIVQSPVIKDTHFDLVIAPRHDQYTHKNLLPITGALSLITPQKLENAKKQWQAVFETLPSPRVAVLIGGTSRTHRITKEVITTLADRLALLAQKNHRLMITASRRTPPEMQQFLRSRLTHANIYFWDGLGDNPYQGILAWADTILVTEDSVSMISEAISTGKPVYIIPLEGGSSRFTRFYDDIFAKNYARPFQGAIDSWTYTPPDDLAQATSRVKLLFT